MTASISRITTTPETPWLGLRPFTEDAQQYFFGRQAELDDVCNRILDRPLTVLFGQSGLGKSSLLQAALMPRLRVEGVLPVHVRFDHEVKAPALDVQLLSALASTLAKAGFPAQAQAARDILREGFDPASALWLLFHDPLHGFCAPIDGQQPRLVVLIDQFEEIFTLGDRPARREVSIALRESLATMIENRPPPTLRARLEGDDDLSERLEYRARPLRFLLSLREDFLHVLERWRRSIPSLMENRLELRMLNGPQALDAVVKPGQQREGQPAIIPDEVGRAIVRFVAGVGDDVPLLEIDAVPPLLSLVCSELNAQRLAAGEVQISRAQFEGHSDDILKGFYERSFDLASYSQLPPEKPESQTALVSVRHLIEDRLLSPDGFRENIAYDTIRRDLAQTIGNETAQSVLDTVIERRLLTVEERGGVRRLELAHDVLTRIVKVSRDERQEKEAIARAQREKEQAESETTRIRAERNRLRRLAIIAVICAVVAAAGASFGIIGMIRARRAADEATRGFSAARAATDTFLTRMAEDELAYVPGIQGVREEMADKAIGQYEAMLATRPGDIDLRLALAKARRVRANILGQIGTVAEAENAFQDCLSAVNTLLVARRTDDVVLLLAETENDVGEFRVGAGLRGGLELIHSALARAEPLLNGEQAVRAAALCVSAYNSLGNEVADREEKIRWFSKGRELAVKFRDAANGKDQVAQDLLSDLSSVTWNLGRQLFFRADEGDKKRAAELLKEGEELDTRLQAIHPDSPAQQRNIAITYEWKVDELKALGRLVEARQMFEKSVALWRASSHNNPGVTRYHNGLVATLKDYAIFVSRAGDYDAARVAYAEAAELSGKIVGVRAERPADVAALLDVSNQYADFEQSIGKGNPEAATRIRAEAIRLGRDLVARYPSSITLLAQHAADLVNQARNSPVMDRPKEAAALMHEALALYDHQRTKNPELFQTSHAENYLNWTISLQEVLKKLAATDAKERTQLEHERDLLLDQALTWEPLATSYDAKQSLLEIASERGERYLAAKEAARAIVLHRRMIALAEKDLAAKPYFWYLRWWMAAQYFDLADAYRQTGAVHDEILARQEAIRIRLVRDYGTGPFEDVLKSDAAPTPEFLERLRTVMDWKPKQKMFVIPCEVNGVKVPVQFYIHGGVPQPGYDPLADQATWMKEERGVSVPEDVRDSIRKLADIARDDKVDFVALMDYALPGKNDDGTADLAKLRQDAGVKVGQLDTDEGNDSKRIAAAAALEKLGNYFNKQKHYREAETQYLAALKLLETLPEAAVAKEHLVPTHWSLAKLYETTQHADKSLEHFLTELRLTRELAEAAPTNSDAQQSLLVSLNNLRRLYSERDDVPEALKYGDAAIKIQEWLTAEKPDNPERSRECAVDLHIQGTLLCLSGWDGVEASLPYLTRASRMFAALGAAGKLSNDARDYPEIAASWQRRVEAILAAKKAYRPGDPDGAYRLASAVLALGAGKISSPLVEQSLDLLRGLPAGFHDNLGAQKLLVAELEKLNRNKEILVPLGKWLSIKPDDPDALDKQSDLFFKAKNYVEAAVSYGKLMRVQRAEVEKTKDAAAMREYARAWSNRCISLMNSDNPASARDELLAALDWFTTPERRDQMQSWILKCRRLLVELYTEKTHETQKALEVQEAVTAGLSADLDKADELAFTTGRERAVLASVQADGGKPKDATASFEVSLPLLRRAFRNSPSIEHFNECFQTLNAYATFLEKSGDKDGAVQQAGKLIEFCGAPEVAELLPENALRKRQMSSHQVMRRLLQAHGQYADALTHSEIIVKLARQQVESLPEDDPARKTAIAELASALGNHSWSLILAKKFDPALDAARESVRYDPSIWVEGNLAHALLLSGHFDEAMTIYTKHRGEKIEINGNIPWEEMVRIDFDELRSEGLDHSDFPRVEATLGITRKTK